MVFLRSYFLTMFIL